MGYTNLKYLKDQQSLDILHIGRNYSERILRDWSWLKGSQGVPEEFVGVCTVNVDSNLIAGFKLSG